MYEKRRLFRHLYCEYRHLSCQGSHVTPPAMSGFHALLLYIIVHIYQHVVIITLCCGPVGLQVGLARGYPAQEELQPGGGCCVVELHLKEAG